MLVVVVVVEEVAVAGEKGAVSMGRRLTRGLTTLERG